MTLTSIFLTIDSFEHDSMLNALLPRVALKREERLLGALRHRW